MQFSFCLGNVFGETVLEEKPRRKACSQRAKVIEEKNFAILNIVLFCKCNQAKRLK